jgi:transketolase
MRKIFADELFTLLGENKDTWLLLGDVGYGIFNEHRKTYRSRVINCGAAEHTMLCMAVGLAMEGKLVFAYTITPFLLWRGAEVIRNYIHHEEIPVKLVGSGRGREYEKDGFSHCCVEDIDLMKAMFYNIEKFRPEKKEEIPKMFQEVVKNNKPSYLNLSRF